MSTSPRSLLFVFALSGTVAQATIAHAAAPDPYDAALVRADEASRRGDVAGAARVLSAVVPAYPQDYAIAVALGRLELRAAAYADSERAFRLAIRRAPGARDAHLGLGWALVKEGNCDAASSELRALVDGGPYTDDARLGLAACAPPSPGPWTLGAAWDQYLFPNHPFKTSGTGVVVADASALVADHWALAGAYRFVDFQTNAASGVAPFEQNEGYAHLGYEAARAGILVDGAVIQDGSGLYGTSFHAGASARWSAYGDVLLQGALSAYKDATIGRVAPQWKLHVAGPLSVLPGVALQVAPGGAFPNASLTASAEWPSVSVWVGGKWGEEVRPAYLDQNVVYDIPERVELGAWAGARARIFRGLWVQVRYSFDRLRRTDALSPNESDLHAFALGPSVNF